MKKFKLTLFAAAACVFSCAADQEPASVPVDFMDSYFRMVYVAGGDFVMGATAEQGAEAEANEKPAHDVHVDSFYISDKEVTQKLFATVMGYAPGNLIINAPDHPVACVSWADAVEFTERLSRFTGVEFRLPTESEWEYACRGGAKSKHYKYSGSNEASKVARFDPDKGNHIGAFTSLPVASLSSNELGLYDMSGNVHEWVADGNYYYDGSEAPEGHIYRGGAFTTDAKGCRVSNRAFDRGIGVGLGFRIAASAMPAEKELKKQIKELRKKEADFPKTGGPTIVLLNFINSGDMERAKNYASNWMKAENGATIVPRSDVKAIKKALGTRYDSKGINARQRLTAFGGLFGTASIKEIYDVLNDLIEYDR